MIKGIESKIVSRKQLPSLVRRLRKEGRRIVFTNGCFDILHWGHVYYLARARELGDVLIVGVNSDASVRRLKGKDRPVNPLRDRLRVLAGLEVVDYVVSFSEDTPIRLIRTVRPDVLVKGGDWRVKDIVGADEVISWGGEVVTIPLRRGRSTTGIISRIIKDKRR